MAQLQIEMAEQGAASEAASKRLDTLSGQWQIFKNNLNEVLYGALKPVSMALRDLLELFNDLNKMSFAGWTENLPDWAKILFPIEQLASFLTADPLGDWARGSSDNMEQLATATAEASDAFNSQQQTVEALDKELARMLLQKGTLKDGSIQLQAETATLTNRFSGLATELVGVGNSYEGVISAMRRYRSEQLRELSNNAVAAGNAAAGERAGYKTGAEADYNQLRSVKLPPEFQARLDVLLRRRTVVPDAGAYRDLANELEAKDKDGKNRGNIALLRSLVSNATRFATSNRQVQKSQAEERSANVLRSPRGTQLNSSLLALTTSVASGQSTSVGMALKGRQELSASLAKEADTRIAEVQEVIKKAKPENKQALTDLFLTPLEGLKAQAELIGQETKKESSAISRDVKAAEREAKRYENERERADKALAAARIKTAEMDLAELFQASKDGGVIEDFSKFQADVEKGIADWTAARWAATTAEIATRKMTPEEIAVLTRETKAQIAIFEERNRRQIVDSLAAQFETASKAIEAKSANMLAPYEAAIAKAQGSAAGLDRFSLQGRVPDYTRDLANSRVAQAEEAALPARLEANQRRLASLSTAYETMAADAAKMSEAQRAWADITVLEPLRQKLSDIRTEITGIQAQLEAGNQIPQTLGQALGQAASQWRTLNAGAMSFKGILSGDMLSGINQMQQGFANMFANIISGSQSALGAFGTFATGIMDWLVEMAAKAIATQMFSLLLSAFAPTGRTATPGNFDPGNIGNFNVQPINFGGNFNGGAITGYSGGGKVNHGVPNRDSVLTGLARGEYVIRKKAVDMVGTGFLNQLNKTGKPPLAPMIMPIGLGNKQETNVYVVKPDARPQMGPNDVLVVLHDDILRGGQTKQLIRQISNGA